MKGNHKNDDQYKYIMEADKTLNQGEYGKVKSPEVIASGGLGPCIAIGIYDKKRKCGYMIHADNAHYNKVVTDLLNRILVKSKLNNLTIYVAGGGANSNDDDYASVMESRDYVTEELRSRFNSDQITIEWNKHNDTHELFLDTSNGKFYNENSNEEDDFLDGLNEFND